MDVLVDGTVVAVNGYMPTVTPKHVLAAAAHTFTNRPVAGCDCQELLQMIKVGISL